MIDNYSRSRDKIIGPSPREHWEVDVRNLPQKANKQDIAYYLWKTLDSCQGLVKNGNPIIQLALIQNDTCLRLNFRTEQQAKNCLQLNQLYFGKKVLFITSRFLNLIRHKPLNLDKLKIVKDEVRQKFRQIYVGNLPYMQPFQLINYLSEFGILSSFINQTKDPSSSSCYCQYINDQQTQQALKKMDNSKIKGRSVIAKRSILMKTKQTAKTKITSTITKGSRFQCLDEMYLTFDTEGFFKNKKISCVLLLKGIIPLGANLQQTLADIKGQVQKIGPLSRVAHKNQNVYLEYEKVQYSQIAYLLISKRKYDGKDIDILFYDPMKFADDILI